MRSLRALVAYLLAVFVGGALLAPWLYRLGQLAGASFPHVAHSPFHRFMDRSFLIVALAGLWPLLRVLGVTSLRGCGLVSPRGQWTKLGSGLLLGGAIIGLDAALTLIGNGRSINPNLAAHKIVGALFGAAGTAIAVAVIEETLFRGGVFGGLRKTFSWPPALVASSLVYAFVHFLRPAELAGPVAWNSGLLLLPQMLDLRALVPDFFNLLLAGALLALAYQRTGNLYFSIGLHAGWIFCLKLYGALTAGAAHAVSAFWGSGKMIDGWLAFLLLSIALAAFQQLAFKPAREPLAIAQ